MKICRENQQHQNRSALQPCYHVLSQRIGVFKHCILNYECYHCDYDQWLDEIDLEAAPKKIGTGTCEASQAVAA